MPEIRYPYDVLEEFGIHPRSPVNTIQQEFSPFGREQREAWDTLRFPGRRLKVDFFLYQIKDESKLTAFQEHLRSALSPPSTMEVRRRLRDDAPIILLLMGRRQEALEILLDRQNNNPADAVTAHRLALFFYAQAQNHEESGNHDEAINAWRMAIANWVRTLTDDAYWESWCQAREACYGSQKLDPKLKEAARHELRQYLAREFSEYAEHYWREGKQARTEAYRELETLYEIEWQGALALKAAGGMKINDDDQTISCGPLLLHHLKLETAFSQMVKEMQDDLDRYAAMSPAVALRNRELEPKVSGEAVKQLRLYFSELAKAAALLRLNTPEVAFPMLLSLLPTSRRGAQVSFDGKNHAYRFLADNAQKFHRDAGELTIQVNIAITRQHITVAPPNLSAALAGWRRVLQRMGVVGMEKEAAKAISDLVVGRAQAFQNETERDTLERMNEAVVLLEIAYDVLQETDEGVVASNLADILFQRGRWYFKQEDNNEMARKDLEKAFTLNPHSVLIRDKLCSVLIECAFDHEKAKNNQLAIRLLERVKNLAVAGLRDNPSDESLEETVQSAEYELKRLQDPAAFWSTLGTLVDPRSVPEAVVELIKKAGNKRDDDDYAGAIADLKQALAIDTNLALTNAEMAATYAKWAKALFSDGEVDAAEEKVKLGLEQQSEAPALLELQKQINWYRETFER